MLLLCSCKPNMYLKDSAKVNPRFVKKYGHTLKREEVYPFEIIERATVEKTMPIKKYKIQNLKNYYYIFSAGALAENYYIPKSKNKNKILTDISYGRSRFHERLIDSISTLDLAREQAWKNLLITNMVNSIYTDISASEKIKNSFPANAKPLKNKDEYYFNLFQMIPPEGYTNPLEVVRDTSPYLKNIKGSHYNYTYRLLNLNKSYESNLVYFRWSKPKSVIVPPSQKSPSYLDSTITVKKISEGSYTPFRDIISFEIYNAFIPRDTANGPVGAIIGYENKTVSNHYFYNQHFMPMNNFGKERIKIENYGKYKIHYTQYYPFYDYATKIAVVHGLRHSYRDCKTGYLEAIALKDHYYWLKSDINQRPAFPQDSIVGVSIKDTFFYYYHKIKPDHYLWIAQIRRDTVFYEFSKDTICYRSGYYVGSDYQNPSDLVLIFDKNHYNFDFNVSRLYYSLEPFLSFEQPESYIPFFVLLTDTYFGTDGSTFKYKWQKNNQLYFTFFSTKMQKEIELAFKKSKDPVITFKEKKDNL